MRWQCHVSTTNRRPPLTQYSLRAPATDGTGRPAVALRASLADRLLRLRQRIKEPAGCSLQLLSVGLGIHVHPLRKHDGRHRQRAAHQSPLASHRTGRARLPPPPPPPSPVYVSIDHRHRPSVVVDRSAKSARGYGIVTTDHQSARSAASAMHATCMPDQTYKYHHRGACSCYETNVSSLSKHRCTADQQQSQSMLSASFPPISLLCVTSSNFTSYFFISRNDSL
jgi:hypothetical protein